MTKNEIEQFCNKAVEAHNLELLSVCVFYPCQGDKLKVSWLVNGPKGEKYFQSEIGEITTNLPQDLIECVGYYNLEFDNK